MQRHRTRIHLRIGSRTNQHDPNSKCNCACTCKGKGNCNSKEKAVADDGEEDDDVLGATDEGDDAVPSATFLQSAVAVENTAEQTHNHNNFRSGWKMACDDGAGTPNAVQIAIEKQTAQYQQLRERLPFVQFEMHMRAQPKQNKTK